MCCGDPSDTGDPMPCDRIARLLVSSRRLKILALDTSTEQCSAALWIHGHIAARNVHAGQRHTELLLGMIDGLLAAESLRPRDLSGIAYGMGPGSFTGLRIGCGVVQGLALGANLPVVGVGTLMAMAAGSGGQRAVCCVDARMNEIYHAAYELRGGAWHVVHEPSTCAPDRVPALSGADWIGCGNGFAVYEDALAGAYRAHLSRIDTRAYPHARNIAALAVPLFESGATLTPEQAAPIYLRDKVALRIDERANP